MLIAVNVGDSLIAINPEHIVSIQPRFENQCTISMVDGNSIIVPKSMEAVVKEIADKLDDICKGLYESKKGF